MLFLSFVLEMPWERRLASKLGKAFHPIAILVVILATLAGVSFVLLFLSAKPFSDPITYWFLFMVPLALTSLVVLVVILLAQPSRLERFLTHKFAKPTPYSSAYRAVAYLVLIALLVVAAQIVYRSHSVG